jgi:hypothetical protein
MSDEVLTQDQLSVPYNPNLLVTYKYIPDSSAGNTDHTQNYFMTEKVASIEYNLHQARTYANAAHERRKDIAWLEDQISEWYNPNYEKDDVLNHLAEHFGINPVKQIDIYGTVTFSGTITVPVAELEDFDLNNVTIDVDLNSYDYEADLNVDEVSLEDNT